MTALDRWRADLAAWAIPQEILDRAAASPWSPERAIFVRRAADRVRAPRGVSYERAREALPEGGTVLDVGAGGGAASLPLLDRASTLTAVDPDRELLAALVERAGPAAARVRTVEGVWPDAAAGLPTADVAVCHHVLYNVPDLAPFIAALAARATRRVVIEITARHPMSRINPLWEHFHALRRPERPTAEDAAAAVAEVVGPVRLERSVLVAESSAGSWDELVAFTARRLCLPAERRPEVAAALERLLGARPDDPATWNGSTRDLATIWWDRAG